MKKKIFLAISAILVFGLAIVVYSSSSATDLTTDAIAASCCCSHGDSCPMKAKSSDGKETASHCDNCNCCHGDGESCPMMKAGADGKLAKMSHTKDCPMMNKGDTSSTAATAVVKEEGKTSCPMMNKDADGKSVKMDNADATGIHMKHHMGKDGKGCDCPCCNKAKDAVKQDAPAV
ncbi:MAG: hypothetical protein IPL32_09720 [Chloracidobacterium sp.]|nr:hypothetical protein [Chloracidobacterium sp.]